MVLSYLIKGTFWLTAAGLITRTAGFSDKIFLSRIIGAEEIGLFQLCMPLYTFCLAAASGGIQTALSRFIAETGSEKRSGRNTVLPSDRAFSHIFISLLLAFCLWCFSDVIAVRFLSGDKMSVAAAAARTLASLLRRAPCLIGYFLGKKAGGDHGALSTN